MMTVFASHGNDVWNRHHCSRAAGGCDGSVFSVSSGGGGSKWQVGAVVVVVVLAGWMVMTREMFM